MIHPWLHLIADGTDKEQLKRRELRQLRLAMQEAIQQENWRLLLRLDRLCQQSTATLTPSNLTRDLAVEMIRIHELYRNMVCNINQQMANTVRAR